MVHRIGGIMKRYKVNGMVLFLLTNAIFLKPIMGLSAAREKKYRSILSTPHYGRLRKACQWIQSKVEDISAQRKRRYQRCRCMFM